MAEMFVRKRSHRISDRAKVVDDDVAVDAETLLDQRRADDPRIVGQLQHLAADRACEGDRELIGETAVLAPELLPGELEAAMLGGLERYRLAERDDTTPVDLRDGKAGMGTADVRDSDLPHAPSATIAAIIADAPASA